MTKQKRAFRASLFRGALPVLFSLAACATKPVAEPAPLATEKADAVVECVREDDKRTLEIADKPVGCELTYFKLGKPEKIVSTSIGPQVCLSTRDEIRVNLQNAGFTCQ